jgi:hypothetical protein
MSKFFENLGAVFFLAVAATAVFGVVKIFFDIGVWVVGLFL